MNKTILTLRAIAIFIFFTLFFILIDGEWPIENFYKSIRSLIFSLSVLAIILNPSIKKSLLFISGLMLILMIIFYLLNQLMIADWIGSLGFGIVAITIAGYLPELIRRGYIKNL